MSVQLCLVTLYMHKNIPKLVFLQRTVETRASSMTGHRGGKTRKAVFTLVTRGQFFDVGVKNLQL